MAAQEPDEEFEYLVNLLASDGVEPDLAALGADAARTREGNSGESGFRIRRGSDGRLDLGQVKAFYEKKNLGVGLEEEERKGVGKTLTGVPRSTDHSSRIRSGNSTGRALPPKEDASAFCKGRQTISPSSKQELTLPPCHTVLQPDFQGQTQAPGLLPLVGGSKRWVDLISEQEARRLLLEISDALRLRHPSDNNPRSATDGPPALNDVKNVVEFLVRMDELVWRRSEHGADHGVFESKNISAVEERVRLWEKIARS